MYSSRGLMSQEHLIELLANPWLMAQTACRSPLLHFEQKNLVLAHAGHSNQWLLTEETLPGSLHY